MTNNEREILGFNSGQTDMQPRQDPSKREGAPKLERAAFVQEETCLMSCEDRCRRYDDAVFCFNCHSDRGNFFVCCLTQLCLDCHEMLFSHDPQCCSQLNGNNREWTNTDDMKTGKEINNENKRRNREAYTHRKRAGGSNKKNMKKPPIERISASSGDTLSFVSDTPEEETCIHLYARLKNCVLYYSKRHGIYVNQLDGVQYECCFNGGWVNGSWDSGRDSFLRYQGPETYKLLDFAPNATFSYFGNKYTLYGEIYSPMLVEALTMDMPLPSEDKRNLRAIHAFIVKRFRLVPDEIQQSSIIVYLYKLSLISPSALPADTVWQNYTPMPCQLFTRQRMVIAPTSCKIPNDWNFNCRFKIQPHGNASFQLGDDWKPFNTPFIEHPRFTGKIEPDKSRYVNVALCKIKPSTDFEYYEISGPIS